MAIKYVCDRCGKESDDREELATITHPIWQNYSGGISNWPIINTDLCSACIRMLTDFMEPLPHESKE